jgi:hypothetical protein
MLSVVWRLKYIVRLSSGWTEEQNLPIIYQQVVLLVAWLLYEASLLFGVGACIFIFLKKCIIKLQYHCQSQKKNMSPVGDLQNVLENGGMEFENNLNCVKKTYFRNMSLWLSYPWNLKKHLLIKLCIFMHPFFNFLFSWYDLFVVSKW